MKIHDLFEGKGSKEEAGYIPRPRNGEKCINCTMWRDPNKCTAVAGDISPNGWCEWYAGGAYGKRGKRITESLGALSQWKNEEPVEYVKQLTKFFKAPDELTHKRAVWYNKDGFKRIEVLDEYILHSSPVPHYDYVYSYVDIKVPHDLADDLAKSSESILIDHLKGEVGGRCASLSANAVTIQYVIDVVEGNVRPSKQEYEKRIKSMKKMFADGKRYELEWWPDITGDADPKNKYYKESKNRYNEFSLLEAEGLGLTIFDIDETLMRTTAKIKVVKDGKVIRSLTNQEFNNYKLQPGEQFDFGEFRNAEKFRRESQPIAPMIAKLKAILQNAGDSKVIMLTARADFDDKETFLNTFRDLGIDMSRVHVHRAGNLSGNPAENKAVWIKKYLDTGKYSRVRLYDDSMGNIKMFNALAKEYPNIKFFPYLVTHEGGIKTVREDGRIVKGVNTTVDVGPNEIKTQAAKFGNTVDKDGRPPIMSKAVKGKSTNVLYNLGLAESYKLQLERDKQMLVLNITNTNTGRRTEVRGKLGYESGNYDPNDDLHQLLDALGKSASISDLMNGDVVTINPRHPDGDRAKAATDRAYNEERYTAREWAIIEGGHSLEESKPRQPGDIFKALSEYEIEDRHPNEKPLGPEFKPSMPKGTIRVKVSDVYDWYKLGQHISDLEGLGKHDFGKGPPEAVISFGSEEQEHKYIELLKKLGLDIIDVDPGEHGDIKGIEKDPTYNTENFADGKNPGRKGLAKRVGVNTKASVSSLRKTAKNSSGEKQRMAHWLANMKAGRAKKK